jgi:hypothetical protein
MAKQQMLLAGITPDTAIYYIVNPTDKSNTGVVIRDSEVTYVPFWSYVDRLGTTLNPVANSRFLRSLWMLEIIEDDEWETKFFTQDVAFNDDDLDSIKTFLMDVPKERKSKPQSDELIS